MTNKISLSERLDRLQEQKLKLPEPIVIEHADGIAYAVFNDGNDLVFYEEMLPQIFQECPIVCFGGYMNAFELGRLQ